MKAKSFQLSRSLYGIKDALVDINKDIEETKRRLLEIQFNATVASMLFHDN